MKLIELLQGTKHKGLQEVGVVWIQAGDESPLFCTLLINKIAAIWQLDLRPLDAETTDEHDMQAQCDISILGQSVCFWLKNLEEASPAAQKKIRAYLAQYAGPHKIISLGQPSSKKAFSLTIDPHITQAHYPILYKFITDQDLPAQDPFISKLFGSYKQLTLDAACMLVQYHTILGRRHDQFLNVWLERIVPPDHSLFTLSQYFFARDKQRFAALWHKMSAIYPDEFWTVYWSEQLWQAAMYVQSKRNPDALITTQKFRLPFSFMQKDWKTYQLHELTRAHELIYDIDYQLKNGAGQGGIDLFCIEFIQGQFKNRTS